jgi:hypothetical protein
MAMCRPPAARHAERARALLQRRHALLEHRDGRVGDAAVDVAADLEVEQARAWSTSRKTNDVVW